MNSQAQDIKLLLGEKIDRLAPQLLSAPPFRDGDKWRWGSLSGEEGQSLCVWVRGPKRGRWFEFNGQYGGDALDLVAKCKFGGDIGEALKWARDWLGLGSLSEPELRQQQDRARDAAKRRDIEDAKKRQQRAADAKAIWLAAAPLRHDDTVWRYLSGRGIDLGLLARPPGALRCHPNLHHHKTGTSWPAMVAAIAAPDGTHVATQRTWLEIPAGLDFTVRKAPLGPDAKMTLGPFRQFGAAIHLTRGASGKPWKDAPEGETIAFAEGIEDALTVGCARPDLRVAACATSLAYLANVALPLGCKEIIVIGQWDPKGSDAMKAQKKGIEGLRTRGYRVSVLRPPVFLKDINDWAQWLRSHPEIKGEEMA